MDQRQQPKGRVTVQVNGPALRHIRVLTGVGSAELSRSLKVSRAYISKIELGYSSNVSGRFYASLCAALGITDRRVLMVNPNAEVVEDAA